MRCRRKNSRVNRRGPQASVNRRVADAARLKEEGNEMLRGGDAEGALGCYDEGGASMALLAETAGTILSKRLGETV